MDKNDIKGAKASFILNFNHLLFSNLFSIDA